MQQLELCVDCHAAEPIPGSYRCQGCRNEIDRQLNGYVYDRRELDYFKNAAKFVFAAIVLCWLAKLAWTALGL